MSSGAVAVTGLSVRGTLFPGLPVIQALRAEPAFARPIVGFSTDPLDPANYDSGLVDACFLMPLPKHGPAALLERIEHAHSKHPLAAIVPTLDSELPLFIGLEERLREMGIAMLVPRPDAFELRSKVRLPELAALTGLNIPHTRVAHTQEAALGAAREFQFPFVLKGRLHGATKVASLDQLQAMLKAQQAGPAYPLVLQQHIPGVEFDVAALGDRSVALIGAVPMKKLQLDGAGKAWGGLTVDDPALLDAARRVVEKLRWTGALELELIRHAATGQLVLIEVNPRFPAWIHLAVAAGQNLPWALLRLALGEQLQPLEGYHAGVMSLRRCVDVTCSLSVYECLATSGEMDHLNPVENHIQPRWVDMRGVPSS
jgi:carbamoyl-phosphate synthase large subunit